MCVCVCVLTYVLRGVGQLVVVADAHLALGADPKDVVGAGLQVLNPDLLACRQKRRLVVASKWHGKARRNEQRVGVNFSIVNPTE